MSLLCCRCAVMFQTRADDDCMILAGDSWAMVACAEPILHQAEPLRLAVTNEILRCTVRTGNTDGCPASVKIATSLDRPATGRELGALEYHSVLWDQEFPVPCLEVRLLLSSSSGDGARPSTSVSDAERLFHDRKAAGGNVVTELNSTIERVATVCTLRGDCTRALVRFKDITSPVMTSPDPQTSFEASTAGPQSTWTIDPPASEISVGGLKHSRSKSQVSSLHRMQFQLRCRMLRMLVFFCGGTCVNMMPWCSAITCVSTHTHVLCSVPLLAICCCCGICGRLLPPSAFHFTTSRV